MIVWGIKIRVKILGPGPKSLGLKPVGLYIEENLSKIENNGELYIITALCTTDELDRLKDYSKIIFSKHGKIKAIVGIDLGISKLALNKLNMILGDKNVNIYHNPMDSVFHPKLYIIKISKKLGIVIVGSSNFTIGGFYKNFEVNVALELSLDKDERNFFNKFVNLFDNISKSKSAPNLTENLISELIKKEIHRTKGITTSEKLPDIFKGERHGWEMGEPGHQEIFLMTLSYNDVSGKRLGDPYIRIPVMAVRKNNKFWGWMTSFKVLPGGKHLERILTIKYYKKASQNRLYFADSPDEYRLVLPEIYTLGEKYQGSVLKISKKKKIYDIELIPKKSANYNYYLKLCIEKAPKGKAEIAKVWGYI